MERVIATNSVAFGSADTAPGSGTPQYFTSGNPASSIPATTLPAYFLNMLQDEIRKVITDAGLTPSETNWGQLSAAIQALISASSPTHRILLTANTTYYVATTGNDTTGDGTSGNPWATAQHAYNWVQDHVDLCGFIVTIHRADGAYTDGVIAGGPLTGQVGVGGVIFDGNSATPSNVTVTTSGVDCYSAQGGAGFVVQNQKLSATGGVSNCLSSLGSGSALSVGAGVLFSTAALAHMDVDIAGEILLQNAYTIDGNATVHIRCVNSGLIYNGGGGYTCTLTGTPAFSTAFAVAANMGEIYMPAVTYSGSATGSRYSSTYNSLIQTSGGGSTYFPGNSVGSVANGGLYA